MTRKLPKGITQRGSSFRVSVMVDGTRHSTTKATLEAAQEALVEFRNPSFFGSKEATSETVLHMAFTDYENERLIAQDMKQTTITSFLSKANQIMNYFGRDANFNEITYASLTAYQTNAKNERGVSKITVSAEYTALRSAMLHAKVMGRTAVKIPDFPKIILKRGRTRFLSDEEELKILKYLDHIADKETSQIIQILLDAGLRVDVDLLKLPWQDFSLVERKIYVWEGKSVKPRAVPMTKRVVAILEERKRTHGEQKGPFTNRTYMTFRNHWQSMREALGYADDPQFVIHMLKHTFCTRLVAGGIDLKTVQILAGHNDIQTTMKYAQFIPEKMFEALEVLERGK